MGNGNILSDIVSSFELKPIGNKLADFSTNSVQTTDVFSPTTTTIDASQFTFSPSNQKDLSFIVGSPQASVQTKKEASTIPSQTISPQISPSVETSQSAKQSGGIPTWLLILGAGAGAFLLLKDNGAKK